MKRGLLDGIDINPAFYWYERPRLPFNVSQRLWELEVLYLHAYDVSGYGPEDVRSATFDFCRQSIQANLIAMNMINALHVGIIPQEHHERVMGMAKISVENQAKNLSDYLRKSLTISLHFYYENMLANILTRLDGKRTTGFEKIIQRLSEQITLEKKEQVFEKLRILMHIRNSFHNNGKHNNDSEEFVVAGLPFKFVTGRVVDSGGWGHIYWLGYATVNSLLKIVSAPEVKKIQAPIDTMYYVPRLTTNKK